MKLTVLVDNNTLIDQYYVGEPGLSFLIEEGNKRILFDTGYSDVFLKNGLKMGYAFTNLDYVVLSHGHNDHTWGVIYLMEYFRDVRGNRKPLPVIVAHPNIFEEKVYEGEMIGSYMGEEQVKEQFTLQLSDRPVWVTEKLVYLGQIPLTNSIENQKPIGQRIVDGQMVDDYLEDDSALVYCSEEGLVIITGCSHVGISNIIAHAQLVCGDNRIADIIGGFHLQKAKPEIMNYTCTYLTANNVQKIHPCHCTDLKAKMELAAVAELEEVGVGLVLEYR